ncbi:MAG: YggT family protein [Pseudomonadota bacterium]
MFEQSTSLLGSLALILHLGLTVYMWMVIIRAVISWVSPSPHNQVVRFLARATDPVLYQIRRILPVFYGGIDFSPVILILLLVFLNDFVVASLSQIGRGMPASGILPLFIISVVRLAQGLLVAMIILVIIRAILSWISPDPYNPIVQFIYGATEPVLFRFRKMLPLVFGGVDFSPYILVGLIYLVISLLDRVILMVGTTPF